MGWTIKGQNANKYRPSATRRASGLSPINERSPGARCRWNVLRQSVMRQSQARRNARERNLKLLKLVEDLNKATEKVHKSHEAQMSRLHAQAKAMNALRDPNYINATKTAQKIYKKGLVKLHGARNKVVDELIRNSMSSQVRRNLYAKGVERGRHGTSEPNWQNWTNKLWHMTEKRQQVAKFFGN